MLTLVNPILRGCGPRYESPRSRYARPSRSPRSPPVHTGLVRILGLVLLLATSSISCSVDGSDYDEEIRNNFLVSCQSEADASSCEKMLNCIEGKLSQDEFLYEERRSFLTGEFSDRLAEVIARCTSD